MHWIIFSIVLLPPAAAFANVGIPTIFVSLPLQIVALGPVIFIEAWVVYRALHQVSFRDVLYTTTKANFLTTFLGIPVTWLLVALMELGGFYIYEHFGHGWAANAPIAKILNAMMTPLVLMGYWGVVGPHYRWAYIASLVLLLIPFYVISWRIEYWVFKKIWKDKDPEYQLKRAVRLANRISYGIICMVLIIWAVIDASNKVSP